MLVKRVGHMFFLSQECMCVCACFVQMWSDVYRHSGSAAAVAAVMVVMLVIIGGGGAAAVVLVVVVLAMAVERAANKQHTRDFQTSPRAAALSGLRTLRAMWKDCVLDVFGICVWSAGLARVPRLNGLQAFGVCH